jgi:virulence factor Mce-like protein
MDRIREELPGAGAVTRWIRAGALAAAAVVLVALAGGSDDRRLVRAEFANVRGLLENNEVRVNGAPAGTITEVALTDRGTAMVTMALADGIPLPRRDAAAAIRPIDLLGDIYLSYSPGSDRLAQEGPIPLSRTTNVPRLADVLQAFQPAARAGLQSLIVELSAGLEHRGVDLNRAAVELRPALSAVERLTAELGSQNAHLGGLVADAERLARRLAARRDDLGQAVTSFAGTLDEVAGHAPNLGRGLDRLAPALAKLRVTSGELTRAAAAARPLADQAGAVAPDLAIAMRELVPFLDALGDVSPAVRPSLRGLRRLLDEGRSTFPALDGGLAALQAEAAPIDSVTETLRQMAPATSQTLFANVASQTEEPGDQPFDPGTDPLRRYWRGAAALTCQSFGLRISPGCLESYVRALRRRRRPAKPTEPRKRHEKRPPRPVREIVAPPLPKRVEDVTKDVTAPVTDAVDKVIGLLTPASRPGDGAGTPQQSVDAVLDYLLGR